MNLSELKSLLNAHSDCHFRIALPAGSPARETLAGALIAAGINLREIAEDRYGLEDIFLAATRRSPAENRRL